jgi:trimeric autotransporter adhesin
MVTVPSTIRDTDGLDGVSITQPGNAYATTIESALNTSTDLAQAGAVFNDAVRLSEGGLWTGSTTLEAASANNQQPYEAMYVQDINAVQADVNAMLANQNAITVGGQTISDASLAGELSEIQGQLATLAHDAPLSVGSSTAAATAQGTIALTQQEILGEVNGDATLAAALNAAAYQSGTGFTNVGFQHLPTGSDTQAALGAAEGSSASPPTLADVGAVFNAANDLSAGGLNATNIAEFNTDMQAVVTGLSNIVNNPTALAAIEANEQAGMSPQGQALTAQQEQALTTVHLETLLNQAELQVNKFDGMYATNPNDAARSTNDNMLDMVDIVNNDAALAAAAGDISVANNGAQPNQTFAASTGGFGEFPGYLNGVGGVNEHGGTILQYQDDQAQTNFWSQFIAQANQLNNTLDGIANGTVTPTSAEIQSLITQVNAYNEFGATFDGSQGGVFGDRFDNELLSGTLKTDSANAVAGLQSIEASGLNATNAAQLVAAGVGFVADANDVSGNNLPTGGGAYVGSATTVPGATTTGAATVGTTVPVAGAVDGNDNPTDTPSNGLTNDGYGASNPNPGGNGSGADGQGGQASSSSNNGQGNEGNEGNGNQGNQGNQGFSNGDGYGGRGNWSGWSGGSHSQDNQDSGNQRFGNQGFGNQGFGNQGASDSGIGDRGHDNFNFHQAMSFFEHMWHHG